MNPIATTSSYFLARGDIGLDAVPFTFYSLIERGGGGIRVIERSRGSGRMRSTNRESRRLPSARWRAGP